MCTFAESVRKTSPSTAITSPHSSPNWRDTSSIVAVVTACHGSVPVRVVEPGRGETLLIIVVIELPSPGRAARWHHSGAVAMEMGRSRGRVKGVLVGGSRGVWSGVRRHVGTFALQRTTCEFNRLEKREKRCLLMLHSTCTSCEVIRTMVVTSHSHET